MDAGSKSSSGHRATQEAKAEAGIQHINIDFLKSSDFFPGFPLVTGNDRGLSGKWRGIFKEKRNTYLKNS